MTAKHGEGDIHDLCQGCFGHHDKGGHGPWDIDNAKAGVCCACGRPNTVAASFLSQWHSVCSQQAVSSNDDAPPPPSDEPPTPAEEPTAKEAAKFFRKKSSVKKPDGFGDL